MQMHMQTANSLLKTYELNESAGRHVCAHVCVHVFVHVCMCDVRGGADADACTLQTELLFACTHTRTHTLVFYVNEARTVQLFLRHISAQPTPPDHVRAARCMRACFSARRYTFAHTRTRKCTRKRTQIHAHTNERIHAQSHAHTDQPWGAVAHSITASLHSQTRMPGCLRESPRDAEWSARIHARKHRGLLPASAESLCRRHEEEREQYQRGQVARHRLDP